jgi:hypothetical protein
MKTTLFSRKISLGKIAYSNPKRKANEVSLSLRLDLHTQKQNRTIDLENISEYVTLSIVGNIWNTRKTDILSGGQNLEEIAKYFPDNKDIQRIVEIWRMYHLNDMRAGTRKQKNAIDTALRILGEKYTYDKACEILKYQNENYKFSNLYNDLGYIYGSSWLVEIIPSEIREEVIQLASNFSTFQR